MEVIYLHDITQFTPQGWVKVLRGVPFDNTYTHTRWFDQKGEQEQYFLQKALYTYNYLTPIRPGTPIRLPVNMHSIYNCNYLMFQNENYGSKWFYCFITDIRWVSVNSCEIDYTLDIVQTWLFDFNWQGCFIVREHSSTDMPGDNLVEENLELGDYVLSDQKSTGKFQNYTYLVAATVDKQGNDAVGGLYAGIYSGLEYNTFTSVSALNTFINNMVSSSKGDSIVSISMFPTVFLSDKGSQMADSSSFTVTKHNGYSENIDGYTPRNKKLLTHPFNFLFVTNLAGNSAELKYEYFGGDDCIMQIFCDMTPNPTVTCVPTAYKGLAANYNEKITMDGFPLCSWSTDTYKAWLAQNGSSTAISTLGTAFSGLSSLLSLNLGGAVQSGVSIAETLARVKATEALPPQAHGTAGNSSLLSLNVKDFWFYRCTIRAEFAKIIDDYFQMYGYATHRVKQPNFHTRQGWNYVETRNAVVSGQAPADATAKMESILNQGITFWHDDQVGYYNRPNSIIS